MESTVVDVSVDPPVMLRLGGLNREDIENVIGDIRGTNKQDLLRRSPGTRHRHYAPKARVYLVPRNSREVFERRLDEIKGNGNTVGIITYSDDLNALEKTQFHLVLSSSIQRYAQDIFRALRELDRLDVDCIMVESVEERGIGAAVMDRLLKAAQHEQ